MNLLPADYVLAGLTIVLAVTGLFRGFSGTLAFLLASSAAVATGSFGWPFSAGLTEEIWMRAAGVLVAVLLIFGLVRMIIRKLVNGLLAQPSDALFGALIGACVGVLIAVGWAWSGFHLEYSNIATQIAAEMSNRGN